MNRFDDLKDVQKELEELLRITHKGMMDAEDSQRLSEARRRLEGLYLTLLSEEMEELRREAPGTPEHMKELCDVLWVLIQYANLCKYDLAKGLEALIDEYESKFYTAEGEYEPIYREDGKLLKNTGFKKADFSKFFRG